VPVSGRGLETAVVVVSDATVVDVVVVVGATVVDVVVVVGATVVVDVVVVVVVVAGVAVMAFDAAESPTELTALMVTGYDDPFVRPVMVNGLTVDAGERAM
jgi:hypothetical protein